MKSSLPLLVGFAATVIALPVAAEQGPDARLAKAKELFGRYAALERAFDPAVADLYSDDAVIRNKRTYPTGEIRELTIPAPQYKQLARATMPLAKARGDVSTYNEVRYKVEGEGVRVRANRFSELKRYDSPLSLLVKPSTSGSWLIHEELSESRP